jgi:hypothetical protein
VQRLAGGSPDRCTVWIMICDDVVGLRVFGGTPRLELLKIGEATCANR